MGTSLELKYWKIFVSIIKKSRYGYLSIYAQKTQVCPNNFCNQRPEVIIKHLGIRGKFLTSPKSSKGHLRWKIHEKMPNFDLDWSKIIYRKDTLEVSFPRKVISRSIKVIPEQKFRNRQILINNLERNERLKESWSSWHLERCERLKGFCIEALFNDLFNHSKIVPKGLLQQKSRNKNYERNGQ